MMTTHIQLISSHLKLCHRICRPYRALQVSNQRSPAHGSSALRLYYDDGYPLYTSDAITTSNIAIQNEAKASPYIAMKHGTARRRKDTSWPARLSVPSHSRGQRQTIEPRMAPRGTQNLCPTPYPEEMEIQLDAKSRDSVSLSEQELIEKSTATGVSTM